MLRLQNLLLPLVRAGPQLPSPIHHGGCRLLLSTSAAPFSLEDYLVASCGLAPAKARSASKKALAEASKFQVATVVSKVPKILGISEETLLRKIQFMTNEVGLELQYILQGPALLLYSLEKRLVPRDYVIKILVAKGLLKTNVSFYTIAVMGEKTFSLKFIDCHKDSVSGLADAFAAACGGSVPPGNQL